MLRQLAFLFERKNISSLAFPMVNFTRTSYRKLTRAAAVVKQTVSIMFCCYRHLPLRTKAQITRLD